MPVSGIVIENFTIRILSPSAPLKRDHGSWRNSGRCEALITVDVQAPATQGLHVVGDRAQREGPRTGSKVGPSTRGALP
jgi:hypothetical protein